MLLLFALQNTEAQTNQTVLNVGAVSPWNVPAGVTEITVEVWGGGGAGGASNSNNDGGSGGGAGGYASATFTVTPNQSIPFSIGAGGIAANVTPANSGGATTFLSLTGNGGGGGRRNGNPVGQGGTGTGGTVNQTGGNGGNGGGSSGGDGGNAFAGGNGGNGNSNSNGSPGQTPGGGGGGGEATFSSRIGGNGGNGQIRITYTIPPVINNLSSCVAIGEAINITGSGFSGTHPVTQVTINGSAVPFTIVNNSQILVTIPAGTTSGPVRVVKSGAFAETTTNLNIQPDIAAISGASAVCVGATINLTNPTPGGTWSSSDDAIATVDPSGVVTGISAGAVQISYAITVDGCTVAVYHNVDVQSTFAIVTEPTSTQVCLGTNASFSINVTGTAGYQWFRGAIALTDDAVYSGVNTPILTINGAGPGQVDNNYYCVVSNACATLSSAVVSLSLYDTPQVQNYTEAICSGQSFSVTPQDGNPIGTVVPAGTTYTWATPVMPAGVTGAVSGTDESTVFGTLVNESPNPQVVTYWVTPTVGTCSGTPFSVSVTVNPTPTVLNYVTQACSGISFATAPVHGAGNVIPADVMYSWAAPMVTGGMTGGSAGSGTQISQTLTNPTGAMQTATYTVTASNACGNSTFTLTVTVYPQPTVAGTPLTQTVCSGTNISTITLSNPNAVPGVVTYTWTRDNLTNVTGIPASGVGETIDGLLTNTTGVAQTVNFNLYATSQDGCESLPYVVSVIVSPIPVAVATPMSQTVCAGTAATILLSTSNALPGVVFNWTRDNANVGGLPASGTGDINTTLLTNATTTAQTVNFTITAGIPGCPVVTMPNVTLTVKPQPSLAVSPLTQTVCSGTSISTLSFTNPNAMAGTTFSWTRDNLTNVTGIPASGTGASVAGVLENNTGVPQTVVFTVMASNAGCDSFALTSTVVVNPAPVVSVSQPSQSICNNTSMTAINFSVTNGVSPVTYSWTRTNATGITGIPASGTTASISGTLVNTTLTTQTTTITMVATYGGCSVTSTATVTVYAPFNAPSIGSNQTVCVFSTPGTIAPTILPSGGSGSYTYQWQSAPEVGGLPGAWTNIGGATSSTYTPPFVGLFADNTFYRLQVFDICSPNVVVSNYVYVEVVTNVGFTFDLANIPTAPLCPGAQFTPRIESAHLGGSYVRFNWTADPAFITPATGGPVGNTTYITFFGVPIAGTSVGNIGPLTVQNTSGAVVNTNVTITPGVYRRSDNTLICTVTPQVVPVTIKPRPVASVVSPAADATFCSATSAQVTVASNVTSSATSYVITRSANASVTSSISFPHSSGNVAVGNTYIIPDVLTNSSSIAQAVTYYITPTADGCQGSAIQIRVYVAPNLQPGAIGTNHSICSFGNPNILTQTSPAVGVNLTYQWESATSSTGPWTPIAGATGTTYDPPAGLTVTTYYRRVVTSTVGATVCSVANTTPVVVTVNDITAGVIGIDQTVCADEIPDPITNVTAETGTGTFTYMWQSSPNEFGPWTDMGITTQTLTFAAPLAQTTYFKRITTSTHGSAACWDETNVVAVIVNQVSGGTIGNDQTLCGASNNPSLIQQLTPATGSGSLTYQWQSSTAADCNSGWTNIPGVAALGMQYDPPAGVSVTTRYRRVTTSTLNGVACTAVSNCITVTANPVTGGAIAGNRTVCYGGDPSAFTQAAASTGSNLSYQWQMSTVSGVGPWTDISGADQPTYDAPGPITQTTYYQRLTFSTVGVDTCEAASNFVTVFVNEVTAPVFAAGPVTCAGEDPAAFNLITPASATGTLTYQWQSSTAGCAGPWTNITGANTASFDPPAVSQTTYYQLVTTSTLNGVSCTAASNCIVVSFVGKTWNGSISQDWNVPANWTPSGVPTLGHCVVIPPSANNPRVLGSGFEALAKSVTVLGGGNLRVLTENTLVVEDEVNVHATGTLHIESSASLVQNSNATNSGTVTIERTTTPMYRFDYTYWNSPVEMGTYTLGHLSPNTQFDKYYSWNPSIGGGAGNWVQESTATVMDPKKGYIVRAPNSFSFTPTVFTPYTATFIGTPNNGDFDIPVTVGTLGPATTDDKLNLIGNPYPSAIDADLLLNDPHNSTLLEGTIYFWTHNAPPSAANPNPFYGSYTYNYSPSGYASYNATGGTTTVPSGYGTAPTGYIASGQSFFAIGIQSGQVQVTNAMRVRGQNNTFFRPGGEQLTAAPERHRIWLNFANTQGLFSQTLVGYVSDATNGIDRRFDGPTMSDGFALYSIAGGKSLGIQGRSLPFDATDVVPLGYTASAAGQYTIGIDRVDGLFEHQDIFLEDKLLGTVHDLRQSAYTFTASAGVVNDRFVLRYVQSQLSNPELSAGQYIAFVADGMLTVSTREDIKAIYLYDMTGKRIRTFKPDSGDQFTAPFDAAQGVYMIKIHLVGGEVLSGKIANQ